MYYVDYYCLQAAGGTISMNFEKGISKIDNEFWPLSSDYPFNAGIISIRATLCAEIFYLGF
jgi:hypothetical protein